jgi:hypothetical protein
MMDRLPSRAGCAVLYQNEQPALLRFNFVAMIITAIDESSPYFKQVIALARANSSTLGFLPKTVFVNGARHRPLLVATDDKGNFLGYLLYGISGKKMLAYIVHLCVHPEHRKKKVATILVHTDGLEARLWASDPIHTAR